MFGGLFCTAFGLTIIALVLYADRSVKSAKRTGVRVTAQVIGHEEKVGTYNSRSYYAKVRFPGPDGRWWEHQSIQGHPKPLQRDYVDVWYDPADPTDVTVDEPGGRSRLVVGVGAGLLFTALGVYWTLDEFR